MQEWAVDKGVLGLFVIAFLAATILPFSSEVALGGALLAGVSPFEAIAAASAGNCLACLLNYGLGSLFRERAKRALEGSWGGKKAVVWIERFGPWALLLSWLPVVGDPLTIVAGLVGVPLPIFLAVV